MFETKPLLVPPRVGSAVVLKLLRLDTGTGIFKPVSIEAGWLFMVYRVGRERTLKFVF